MNNFFYSYQPQLKYLLQHCPDGNILAENPTSTLIFCMTMAVPVKYFRLFQAVRLEIFSGPAISSKEPPVFKSKNSCSPAMIQKFLF
jgi:hypothetical protein